MFTRILLVSAATLALAACSSVDLNEPDNNTIPRICNADNASHVTGKRISAELEQEARRSSGAGMIRVIRPGQMITKEYRSERLNLQLNDYDVVVRAYCG
ncbi:I78 family peptidase inhibitor [Pusillimonas sp.]|uniref:I78 family peptidase inhibitor n=1 Tax=Pusillimonas sp. TaxID=3040095 RepID=UPI0029B481E0|nr:I78 family peptidase inhibitor [Pusillimonas sp.]MDX3895713.1 I78 family peptidase inhibitor [Pusillimonas sp.]